MLETCSSRHGLRAWFIQLGQGKSKKGMKPSQGAAFFTKPGNGIMAEQEIKAKIEVKKGVPGGELLPGAVRLLPQGGRHTE